MDDPQPFNEGHTKSRFLLAGIGALGGFCLWALFTDGEALFSQGPLFLAVKSFAVIFLGVLLAATNLLGLRTASLIALLPAGAGAVLYGWAGTRFAEPRDYTDTVFPLVALTVLATIPVPFLIAHMRPGEGWRNYPALFSHAWNIVVRYIAAWTFVGLGWLIILLSDLLLGLIGLRVFDWISNIDPLPMIIIGGLLGLGLAVADEYANIISPYLVLRLLRLFLPVLVVVLVVFLVGLLLGLGDDTFLGFSDLDVLLIMIGVGVSLISAAIDQSDALGVQGVWMRRAARVMALLLPVLAALSALSLWREVQAEGWWPETVVYAILLAVAAAYALAYAASALDRRSWAQRLRASNIYLALGLTFMMALSLTPLLNPQAIATRSQIAQFLGGSQTADDLPVWYMANDWGIAGQRGIETLLALDSHPEAEQISALITLARESRSAGRFRNAQTAPARADVMARLKGSVAIRPSSATLPNGLFDEGSDSQLNAWARGCETPFEGYEAGCLVILADFLPSVAGDEAVFLYLNGANAVWSEFFVKAPNGVYEAKNLMTFPRFFTAHFKPDDLKAALDGGFEIAPVAINGLILNERQLLPAD